MLTAYEDDELIFQALKAGASGYLVKQTPPSELLDAIVEVHGGGAPMSSNIARKVIRSFHETDTTSAPGENLSERESEILNLLSKGYQYKEISEFLDLAYETVHTHLRKIYRKLHVRSRSEAITKFLKR
jgi:DNA-binding NarL/FixJ family response regulator